MHVMIRLQKAGKTANKRYNYRIVAIQKSASRNGRNLEILGYYDPAKRPAAFSVKKERVDYWVSHGAQLSDTVRSLIKAKK